MKQQARKISPAEMGRQSAETAAAEFGLDEVVGWIESDEWDGLYDEICGVLETEDDEEAYVTAYVERLREIVTKKHHGNVGPGIGC